MNVCSICNSSLVKDETISQMVCSDCGHGYRIYDGDIIEYHKKHYRKNFQRTANEFKDGKVTELFHSARKSIVENRLRLIQKYVSHSDNILDVGSGAGTFANALKKHVNDIQCLELDQSLINECERLGFHTFTKDFLTQDFNTRYDTIFAWHVLEHIDDIHKFVDKCFKLKNKYVIIEVPSERKPSRIFEGHLHYFTKKSLELLCQSLGLQTVDIMDGVQKPAILGVFK